jgi:hypothetical protein
MGKATMIRRPISDVCPCVVGKAVAVQPGAGKVATCKITIKEVRQERLGDLSLKDAKREGFTTTAEFFDYWKTLYGSVDKDQQVWVIAFALGDHTDTPRFLSARIGGAGGDYTTVAALGAQGEGEPLSETETEHYGKLAHAKAETTGLTVLRRKRDVLAAAIEDIASDIPSDPGPWRDRIRRFQRELSLMNQLLEDKVAA